jgi:hypothetical protein
LQHCSNDGEARADGGAEDSARDAQVNYDTMLPGRPARLDAAGRQRIADNGDHHARRDLDRTNTDRDDCRHKRDRQQQ